MSGLSLSGATPEIMESKNGRALRLQTDAPHLVSMGGDRLSTSVTLHPIPQGRVVLGSGPGVDILVQGTGVSPIHCHIENSEGVVTIYPLSENLSVDGVKILEPTRLSQGSMLTIGRSNYLRFNHPAEAKLIKSVLPNPRISMAPITFEQVDHLQTANNPKDVSYQIDRPQQNHQENANVNVKFAKKPPAVPKKSPRGSISDGDETPPSSFMTKLSKFEYLATQNLKKSISPKVFASNAVTVNTPARDVLGKSPPDLCNFSKNLPQSALNYNELNQNNEKQLKGGDNRTMFGKKSPQYVNVTLNDAKNINNRVIVYENGIKHNLNLDEDESLTKTSCGNKNVNVHRVILTPSPGYNRNPGPYNRSVTPSPILTKNVNSAVTKRRSGSLDRLTTNGSCHDNEEEMEEREKEAEIKRNQAQQDRIKEQELEKAEQARLEEILNMCAEYEKQSQNEKNKPITPNRIKTNGSLPRDKRQRPFGAPSSPYNTPPPSPGAFEFPRDPSSLVVAQQRHLGANESDSSPNFPLPRNKVTSNYENVDVATHVGMNGGGGCFGDAYENVFVQGGGSYYPNSPRTRIKTFVTVAKDSSPKESPIVLIENKLAPIEKDDYLLENLNEPQNSTNSSSENCAIESPTARKPTPTKFILPLDDEGVETSTTSEREDVAERKLSNDDEENNRKNNNNASLFSVNAAKTNAEMKNVEFKNERARYECLKKEKRRLMDVVRNLKTLISEIEIQEEELHIEMDMERALLSGEHKSKLLDLDNLKSRKEKLLKQAQKIENVMTDAQNKQTEREKICREKLENAQKKMAEIESELSAADKSSDEYETVFQRYLKSQETLDHERKSFEDLEFHHLEEEADWLATREEIQREIVELTKKQDNLKKNLEELEKQSQETARVNNKEYKSLESQKINCLVRLEEIRNRLRDIEGELGEFSDQETEHEMSSDSDGSGGELLGKMRDMSCSFVVSEGGFPKDFDMSHSFDGRTMRDRAALEPGIEKRFPSQDDIDRISKVTSDSPIDIIASLNKKTAESLKELERNRHLHLCQQGSQVIEHERQRVQALKERAQQEVRNKWARRIQDCASMTSTGSEETGSGEKTDESNNEKGENNKGTCSSPEQSDASRNENEDLHLQRPLSEISEMSIEGGTFRKRCKPAVDKQRPLTRYLPIRSDELDLRHHIESAGHQVVLCPHVLINSSSCRGFLHKKGSKLNGWSRRWFVFDRSKHTFSYYADKSEKKARGGAYFQAIEEVYVDHAKSVKSPNPQLTFIVKTHERQYHLMAPSPEAMRIWVDVIFTGAEGYQEFEHGT